MNTLRLRRFRHVDAAPVSDLFRQVYGPRYVQPDVYFPNMISQHNASGHWYSLLAVDGDTVVGHAALCRDPLDPAHAELALILVHPDAQGRHIATQLGRELLRRSSRLGLEIVSIKQVTSHPFSQKMAGTLGFHSTGLLPDYVPSPFGNPHQETIVLGYAMVNGHARPLPPLHWPDRYQALGERLAEAFGMCAAVAQRPARPLQVCQHHERIELTVQNLRSQTIDQLRRLPEHWLVSLRLELSRRFSQQLEALSLAGFVFTGLMPASQGWFALFHRGARHQPLKLCCTHMQRLHDDVQAVAAHRETHHAPSAA
ncbi:GNAT family N-acetyltransferase [Pseudomonas purpurea]|uniref:GNAT family N-acetyltransferase n=1 Tax=Pseudomonas purpurea TaxID=3136737 RepID=UPI003264EA73